MCGDGTLYMPICECFSFAVGKRTTADHDEINQRTDTTASGSKQPDKSCADLADIEPMYAQPSEENTEQQGNKS